MKKQISFILIIIFLLSCSHHMIKDYTFVTDDNKREYFRVFQKDTSKIFEYCHNNFLPERDQEPMFGNKMWIDVVDNVNLKTVVLVFKKAVYGFEPIIEITIGRDTVQFVSTEKPEVKKRKTHKGPKRVYKYYSYSGDNIDKILEKISLQPEITAGFRSLGNMPKDTIVTRPISGVPIVKEQYKSKFYEFDENEKLGIKNSLELYRDLKRKYK